MFVKVMGWINLAIWTANGILMLTCDFQKLRPKTIKVMYGLVWGVLMWNLLARVLGL